MVFNSAKFEVELSIEKVTRVPFSTGSIFVRWRVTDSPRPDAHGRTKAVSVKRNEARVGFSTIFQQRIRLGTPSRQLKSCPCRFDVVWEPLGGKGVEIGSLNLDIAEFARLPNQSDEELGEHGKRVVAGQTIPFLLKGARTNSLLLLKLDLRWISGNTEYEVPDFSAPTMSFGMEHEGEENDVPAGVGGGTGGAKNSRHDRDRLRRLREDVLLDLREDPTLQQNMKWHDLDQLLQGHDERLVEVRSQMFAEQGVRDPRTAWDIEEHKPGTPYLETEIRDNFVTWNVFGSVLHTKP